jgi:type IV pilus assembly protein PilN
VIRINLLPSKKAIRHKGEAGADTGGDAGSQAWLAFVLGAVLLEVIVLLFVYKTKQDQLTQVQKHNSEVNANIEAIRREIANHNEIKTQLKDLRDREEAIQKLQAARTGPTATMLELTRILTPGRGPTVDRDKLEQMKRDNPTSVPNVNWDTRRMWVKEYRETDRTVKITGLARDGEDVSEFLRRLTLSDYFYEVKILPANKIVDPATRLDVLQFDVSAKVRY